MHMTPTLSQLCIHRRVLCRLTVSAMTYQTLWQRLWKATCTLSGFLGSSLPAFLFLFRYMLTKHTLYEERVYGPSAFTCDTTEPGCAHVCFHEAFPIALHHFWNLQIVCVYLPIFLLLTYLSSVSNTLLMTARGTRVKAPSAQALLPAYVVTTVLRILLEGGFLVAHLCLYGFQVKPVYRCDLSPCPGTVSCSMNNHTKKNVIVVFLLLMACVSLLYNVLELCVKCWKKIKQARPNCSHPEPPLKAGHEPPNLRV